MHTLFPAMNVILCGGEESARYQAFPSDEMAYKLE